MIRRPPRPTLFPSTPLFRSGTKGDFFLSPPGGAYPFSSEVDVPLTYADYYYLEALTRLKRRLQS